MAKKYPRPKNAATATGLYAATRYLYVYVPKEAVEDARSVVAAKEGYKDSSKDHYYRSVGAEMNTARLYRRRRPCACDVCLRIDRRGQCFLSMENADREAGLTPAGTSHKIGEALPPAPPADTRGTSTRRTAANIAEELTVGRDVVLRMHPDERRLNPDDEYFLGRVEEPARKLDAPVCYSTNSFQKNDWIVKIRWYELISVEANGDRMYKKGQVQFLNVKMIVQKLTRQIKLDHVGRSKYCLPHALDDHIVRYGDINI